MIGAPDKIVIVAGDMEHEGDEERKRALKALMMPGAAREQPPMDRAAGEREPMPQGPMDDRERQRRLRMLLRP